MNYGYNSDTDDWQEQRQEALAHALVDLLLSSKPCEQLGPRERPYIEVDGLYRGVRIRKVTNLSEEDREALITKADEVYRRIMQLPTMGTYSVT